MRHFSRAVGVVLVGLVGWAHSAFATKAMNPEMYAPWIIETADYTGEVKEQIARLEARYTIRVIRDGWTEIPLALQGVTVTDIKLEKKVGEAYIRPQGSTYVLATMRKGTYTAPRWPTI